jgi:hypothetical protein
MYRNLISFYESRSDSELENILWKLYGSANQEPYKAALKVAQNRGWIVKDGNRQTGETNE